MLHDHHSSVYTLLKKTLSGKKQKPMVFWEVEEPAYILRHCAHRNDTEKINLN